MHQQFEECTFSFLNEENKLEFRKKNGGTKGWYRLKYLEDLECSMLEIQMIYQTKMNQWFLENQK